MIFIVDKYQFDMDKITIYNSMFMPEYIKFMDALCLKKLFNRKGVIKSAVTKFDNYLSFRYTDEHDPLIAIKRLNYQIEYHPICPICRKNKLTYIGKPNRMYTIYCSCKCSANSKSVIKKKKETQLRNWGTENCYDSSKYQEHLFNKYGFKYWTQDNKIISKRKNTLINRYGTLNVYKIEGVKDKMIKTNLSRYGVPHVMQNEKIRMRYNISRKNKHNKISKPEMALKNLLMELYGDDLDCQYSDKRYPFNCDFYIKSKDIFIEYHGSHFHNTHAFDASSIDDLTLLKNLKQKANKLKHPNQYDKMIYTWTDLDVRKLEIAKANNLKYLVFYKMPTKEELIEKIEGDRN
jgi:hypothetical protein